MIYHIIIFIMSILITIISFVFFGYMLCREHQVENENNNRINDIINVNIKKLYGEPYI
jgi:hypothetical protein